MKKYQYTKPKLSGKPDTYVVSVYVNGVQYKKRVSKKFTPKEQKLYAEALMKKWLEMLDSDLSPFDNEDKKKLLKLNQKITLNEAIQEYKSQFFGSTETLKAYMYKLQHVVNVHGDDELISIKKSDLEKIVKDKIKDGSYSQNTLIQARKTYSIFFRWCVGAGHLKESPAYQMEKVKSEKDIKDFLNPFEEVDFDKIMGYVKKLENPSLYYFINFIYHACIRPKEIRLLQVNDVDLVAKRIRVRASIAKNNKLAYVPLYPQLEDILIKMGIEEADENDYLFSIDCKNVNKKIMGSKMSREDFFADWFRAVLKKLELYDGKGYSIYCFKHTSNIHKVDAGWKTSQLQKLNRHSTIDQTLQYLSKIRKITEIDNLESRTL